MLNGESLVVNRTRTYLVYTEAGMKVRAKKRKKLTRPRVPLVVPRRPKERRSIDFVSDQLSSVRRFRILNVVDDFTRESVRRLVNLSISGCRLTRCLAEFSMDRGKPATVVCDNGPKLTSKAMLFWTSENNIRLHFIQLGKPTQNAFIKSFNGKFRDLEETRYEIEQWRQQYSRVSPTSSLG